MKVWNSRAFLKLAKEVVLVTQLGKAFQSELVRGTNE